MRKGLWIWIHILLVSYTLNAQSVFDLKENSEGKIIIIPKEPTFDFNLHIPEVTYQSYNPSSSTALKNMLKEFIPTHQSTHLSERPVDMQIRSTAYRPFFNAYTPMLRRVSPMALDFRETSIVPLNNNLALFATGEQYTWPGAGGMTSVNPGLIWSNEKWTVAGHGFTGRFYTPFNISPAYMSGGGMQIQYNINEQMVIKGWGQYTHYSDQEKLNPHMLMNPLINHTNAGGAFEFMINENWGVGMGVNYEYNPRRRKMEPQYLVYPIYRSSNTKIQFW